MSNLVHLMKDGQIVSGEPERQAALIKENKANGFKQVTAAVVEQARQKAAEEAEAKRKAKKS
jgi:hypothetical protein